MTRPVLAPGEQVAWETNRDGHEDARQGAYTAWRSGDVLMGTDIETARERFEAQVDALVARFERGLRR